jgi:hypothetical protein
MPLDNMILQGAGAEEGVAGAFRIVVGGKTDGIASRHAGWEVRDSILILLPDGRTRTAWLLQRPGRALDGIARDGAPLNVEAARKIGSGRFPANAMIVHHTSCERPPGACASGCPAASLDAQSGISGNGFDYTYSRRSGKSGEGWGLAKTGTEYADEGGASRFVANFPCEQDAIDWLRLLLGEPTSPDGWFIGYRAEERPSR